MLVGKRVGTKRSDRRWEDDDGVIWASRLECEIFQSISTDDRVVVRRCDQGGSDTFSYTTPIRSALCKSCGSTEAVQERVYTPDLYVYPATPGGDKRGYYIEIKGHFPGPRRTMFRHLLKDKRCPSVRLLLDPQSAYRTATAALTLVEYCHKFMKIPVHVWSGLLPEDWCE